MALLGLDTRLVTALGEDAHAAEIERSCAELGISLKGSVTVPGGATSTYLFIVDRSGEMALAVSDMEICRHLTAEKLEPLLPELNRAKLLVLDANLPKKTVAWLCENITVPIFADPVSTVKADKLQPVLGRIHTLKPNRLEAELLSGGRITDEASLYRAADRLLAAGVKRVYISLGADGVLAAEGDQRVRLESRRSRTVNTTGCGDAFMAGLAWAWCRGMDLAGSARAGMAAASLAMESEETINPALNEDALVRRMAARDE
jgi:pseudouridine kinase